MKKTTLILSIAALASAALLTASCDQTSGTKTSEAVEGQEVSMKGAIVYFNLDRVSQDYDMANDLRSVVETKVNSISEEVNRKASKLQKDVNSFQEKIDKGLLTRSVAEAQSQKLQQQQNDFQKYAAQKEQEIAEEQSVMMNQIADAINEYVEKYNAEKQYAMILTTQGDILSAPVVTADASLNITEEILKGLNEEYVKTMSKK